jgi:o-succinylbenzoate synthase
MKNCAKLFDDWVVCQKAPKKAAAIIRISWRGYCRRFRSPLKTAHGEWRERQGIILRLTDDQGRHAYGECAPLPDFGTESFKEACDWLEAIGPSLDLNRISISQNLPSLSYALACAIRGLAEQINAAIATACPTLIKSTRLPVCALLPSGELAYEKLETALAQGYRIFKWKIGVNDYKVEQGLAETLLQLLPADARLRFDANGGLTPEGAVSWCEWIGSQAKPYCEYLEQPLPPGDESVMANLQARYGVPIALDESLTDGARRPDGLLAKMVANWDGYCVLKPSLLGSSDTWTDAIRHKSPELKGKCIFSSAFETDVGIDALLQLVLESGAILHALGLDTVAAFDDGLNTDLPGPIIDFDPRARLARAEAVWNRLDDEAN